MSAENKNGGGLNSVKTLEQRLAEFRKSLKTLPTKSTTNQPSVSPSTSPSFSSLQVSKGDANLQTSLLDDLIDIGEPELSSSPVPTLAQSPSSPRGVRDAIQFTGDATRRDPTLRSLSSAPAPVQKRVRANVLQRKKRKAYNDEDIRSRSVGPSLRQQLKGGWRSRSVTSSLGGVDISELALPTHGFSRSSSVNSRKSEGEFVRRHQDFNVTMRAQENARSIKEEKRKWKQEKEEAEYKLRQAKAIHEREKRRFQEKVEAMTLQWNEQKAQLEKQKEKLKKQKEKFERESKQLRMDRMKVRLMKEAEQSTILGFESIDSDFGSSLKSEALELWLKEPLAQLEIDRKEVRRREQEVNKAWDEIHAFKERLKRDSQKLKLDRAEYDQRIAHLETLRSKFQNKERDLIEKQKGIEANQKQLAEVKKKLQNHMEKIKRETQQITTQKQSIAEQKQRLEEKNKMLELKLAEIEARSHELVERDRGVQQKLETLQNATDDYLDQTDQLKKDRQELEKSKKKSRDETSRLAALNESLDKREVRVRQKEESLAHREAKLNLARRKFSQEQKKILLSQKMEPPRKFFEKEYRPKKRLETKSSSAEKLIKLKFDHSSSSSSETTLSTDATDI